MASPLRCLALALSGAAGVLACSSFSSTEPLSETSEAGPDTATAIDGSVPTADAGANDADARALLPTFTFCANGGPHLFCDDFDEPGWDAGWDAHTEVDGSVAVAPYGALDNLLVIGSAPSALQASLPTSGRAIFATPHFAVPALGLSARVTFVVPHVYSGSSSVKLLSAKLSGLTQAVYIKAGNATQSQLWCLDGSFAVIDTGKHEMELRVFPASIECYLDGLKLNAQTVASASDLQLELGADGDGPAVVDYDDVVVRSLP
jgi:hypothetical protein